MEGIPSRKVSGHFEGMGFWGELADGDTLSCCHCQLTRIIRKGSGKAWFWCGKCGAYHCDQPACQECLAWEARVENIEAGRPELTPTPVKVLVPDSALWNAGD